MLWHVIFYNHGLFRKPHVDWLLRQRRKKFINIFYQYKKILINFRISEKLNKPTKCPHNFLKADSSVMLRLKDLKPTLEDIFYVQSED